MPQGFPTTAGGCNAPGQSVTREANPNAAIRLWRGGRIGNGSAKGPVRFESGAAGAPGMGVQRVREWRGGRTERDVEPRQLAPRVVELLD
eukprot:3370497-Prymnesium_polylepis.1